jgi:MFS family permease
VFLVAIVTFGTFLFLTFYLQQNLGYSPLKTGVAYLPMVACLMVASIVSNEVLLQRVGARPLITLGLLIAAGGAAFMTRLGVHASYASELLPGLLLIGAGIGTVFSSALNTATDRVPPQYAGVASAVVTTNQQIGASVGIALLNTISSSASKSFLAGKSPTPAIIARATVHGQNVAFMVVVGILIGGAIVCGLITPAKTKVPTQRALLAS